MEWTPGTVPMSFIGMINPNIIYPVLGFTVKNSCF